MKRHTIITIMLLCGIFTANAQMVSYNLQQSFTKSELDSFLSLSGFALPIQPQYDIDVYQVIYKTPYKNIDSLVNASGIVVIPKNTLCPSALGCYGHGTFAKRVEVPSYEGPERPIGFFFAGIGGVVTAMPDELGMGDSDSSIIIHPYINAFHSGYAAVNMMRAARELAATLSVPLSGEVVLTGYSQGGFTTMATNKLIQENFASEFNIVASSPMSGPYDLRKTMVDVMLSTDPFSSPSYLPYLLLGYHSVYPLLQQKYPTPSHIFKSPYDTLIPPLFYSKVRSTGYIDQFCNPIPRNMILDSVINEFSSDTLHIFRQILKENDLMGWVPQNPVKIHYCTADEQVTYLNAIRADSTWRANGANDIQIQNHGNLNHGGCVEPALTSTAVFLLSNLSQCTGIVEYNEFTFSIFPNPVSSTLNISNIKGKSILSILNIEGKEVFSKTTENLNEQVDVSNISSGIYIIELQKINGSISRKKVVIQ
jgi:hypothetical protein